MKRRNFLAAAMILLGMAMFTGCGGTKQETSQESDSETVTDGEDVLDFNVEDYVTLGDYKNLDVTYPKAEVTDDDVEMYIQDELEENTEYNEIEDREAQEGDNVNIDYTGTIDGEEFDGGTDTDYDLVLGSGDFLEDFENNLIGKKAGDTVTFSVTFPEEYFDEETEGKEAEFTVTVNSVSEVIVPEYNADFVAEISDYTTTEEYEESIRAELLAEAEEEASGEAGENALALAVANATVDGYPQALYDSVYNDTVESYQAYAEMFGMEYEDFLSEFMGEDDIEDVVLSEVNEYLVVQAIAEKEGLEVTDSNYEEEAEAMAAEYEYDSLEEFETDYGKTYIITQLLREKVIDFLYESANLQEVSQEEYYGEDEEYEDEEYEDEESEEVILEDEEASEDEEVILEDEEASGDEESEEVILEDEEASEDEE